jgi:uncharacterized membrane protein
MAMLAFMGAQILGGIVGGVVSGEKRQSQICKDTTALQCKTALLSTNLARLKAVQQQELQAEYKKLKDLQDGIEDSTRNLNNTHKQWQSTAKTMEIYLVGIFFVVSLLFLAKRMNISLHNPFDAADIHKKSRGSVLPFVVFVFVIGVTLMLKMGKATM